MVLFGEVVPSYIRKYVTRRQASREHGFVQFYSLFFVFIVEDLTSQFPVLTPRFLASQTIMDSFSLQLQAQLNSSVRYFSSWCYDTATTEQIIHNILHHDVVKSQ